MLNRQMFWILEIDIINVEKGIDLRGQGKTTDQFLLLVRFTPGLGGFYSMPWFDLFLLSVFYCRTSKVLFNSTIWPICTLRVFDSRTQRVLFNSTLWPISTLSVFYSRTRRVLFNSTIWPISARRVCYSWKRCPLTLGQWPTRTKQWSWTGLQWPGTQPLLKTRQRRQRLRKVGICGG